MTAPTALTLTAAARVPIAQRPPFLSRVLLVRRDRATVRNDSGGIVRFNRSCPDSARITITTGEVQMLLSIAWNNSTQLPDGSSSRICLPTMPSMMSLRNVAPRSRSWATVVARSSTCS